MITEIPNKKSGTLDDEKQWNKELMRILKARQVENVDLETVEKLQEAQSRYEKSAKEFQKKVEPESVLELGGKLNDLDQQRWEINKRINQLDKLPENISKLPENKFREGIDLAKRASNMGNFTEANKLLEECEESVSISEEKETSKPPTKRPQWEPQAIESALKRKDLAKHIAENDMWGNFDVGRALKTDPLSESDAKVLWNILESAIKANEQDEKWKKYEEKVETEANKREKLKQKILKASDLCLSFALNKSKEWNPNDKGHKLLGKAGEVIGRAKEALEERKFDTAEKLLQEFLKIDVLEPSDTQKIEKAGEETKPVTIYKELILGTGASAAYYIANNESNMDLTKTLVIGNVQPWAGLRGKDGNINHPHNMIDPEHSKDELTKDKGLAKRTEFSDRVNKVVSRLNSIDAEIQRIIKCKGDFFAVETVKGNFYARKVTNAMGIGKQGLPPGLTIKKGQDQHIKDMDFFKNSLDHKEGVKSIKDVYPDVKSIAVIGGNAAIDVITTILRDKKNNESKESEQLTIHWIVGSRGAQFLKGTDNALAEKVYPEEEFEVSKKGNMTFYKGRLGDVSGTKPMKVTCGNSTFEVDMVVYGTGPDVKAMQDMLVDEPGEGNETKEIGTNSQKTRPMTLEPVFDKNQHYNYYTLEPVEKNPEVLFERLENRLPKGEGKEKKFRDNLLIYLKDPNLNKEAKDNRNDVIIGVKSQDQEGSESSMQFVGASGSRLKTEGKVKNGKGEEMKGTPMSGEKHETVTSLPENVVGNDQLTPSRSRIEAQSNALPTTNEGEEREDQIPLVTQPGGVNFITSNQTVIRVHIAQCYPNIPSGLGDYITGQIIHARSLRPKKGDTTPTPVPVPGENDPMFENLSLKEQEAFQKKWTERLDEINKGLLEG